MPVLEGEFEGDDDWDGLRVSPCDAVDVTVIDALRLADSDWEGVAVSEAEQDRLPVLDSVTEAVPLADLVALGEGVAVLDRVAAWEAEADDEVLGEVDWLGESDPLGVAVALGDRLCVSEAELLCVSLAVALELRVEDCVEVCDPSEDGTTLPDADADLVPDWLDEGDSLLVEDPLGVMEPLRVPL